MYILISLKWVKFRIGNRLWIMWFSDITNKHHAETRRGIFGYFFGSKEKQEFRIFSIYPLMPFLFGILGSLRLILTDNNSLKTAWFFIWSIHRGREAALTTWSDLEMVKKHTSSSHPAVYTQSASRLIYSLFMVGVGWRLCRGILVSVGSQWRYINNVIIIRSALICGSS